MSKLQITTDYEPLYKFLENVDKRKPLNTINNEEVWKMIYEFGFYSAELDKQELLERINFLTEQNVKWTVQALDLELANDQLKKAIQKLQTSLDEYAQEVKPISNIPS